MKLKADTPTKILESSPMRKRSYVTLLTDATVYLSTTEYNEFERYLDNGFPLKVYGVHETPEGFEGDLWAVSDTDNTDLRVIEY